MFFEKRRVFKEQTKLLPVPKQKGCCLHVLPSKKTMLAPVTPDGCQPSGAERAALPQPFTDWAKDKACMSQVSTQHSHLQRDARSTQFHSLAPAISTRAALRSHWGGRFERRTPRAITDLSHRYRGPTLARRTTPLNNTGSGSINLACRSEAHALLSLCIDQPLLSAENILMTECS